KNSWWGKRLGLLGAAALLFLLAGGLLSGSAAADDDAPYPLMHPDQETLQEWIEAYNSAPRAHMAAKGAQLPSPTGSLSLLSHLQYTPSERNQGSCNNCWAWAGTGCLGIALDVQQGIYDRLSVQYINSCEYEVIGKPCCAAGWLYQFANFYDPGSGGTGHCIPWSNTSAHWQDGDASCDTSCGSISTSPDYPISSIHDVTIATQTVDQATAIANIKSVLAQDTAVWFAFFVPDSSAWSDFCDFWNNNGESVAYDIDQFCGAPSGINGGHAVLCVGYDDEDPHNPYWVMLNSWGTAGGNRPNGLFRVDMDMAYDCVNSGYSFYWQTLDVTFGIPGITVSPTSFDVTLLPD
ncbi:MAG: C1 family peptidase, partial [Dehalococcoidia bacterium]|nr:C1 family peptidase [Dehalococcoidia bacterium]